MTIDVTVNVTHATVDLQQMDYILGWGRGEKERKKEWKTIMCSGCKK